MQDFKYVSKKEFAPIKAELLELIHKVQDIIRHKFTFNYKFIGSVDRNMVTYDKKSNIGFDFDVDIYIDDDDEKYTPKQLRSTLKHAIDKVAPSYGYDYCEDSTRVLTIKKKNYKTAKILHSCDFAIVFDGRDGQQYIRHNKNNGTYTWEFQGNGFERLPDKIDWIKNNDLWNNLRNYYIEKKNKNDDPNKHSRSIFAESVHEIYQKY